MPIDFRGLDLTSPINRLKAGFAAMCLNVRAYFKGGFSLRNLLTGAIVTVSDAIQTICRLNDTTPSGPAAGFTYVIASGIDIYVGSTGTPAPIATGMSGDPVSMVPFRPNASVQPWVYIGDSAPTPTGSLTYVTITTKFAINGLTTTFDCSSMLKVRSDGLIYKMGIKEPQTAPVVSTAGTTTTGTDALPATTIPWTNAGGANSTYNYDQTTGGTSPVIILTPVGSQTLTLVVTGTATVNGAVHGPGDVGPTGTGPHGNGYPANFTGGGPTIVLGAFTDGSGNVLTGTSPVPLLANVGAGITLQVPSGAVQFQIGVDSEGDQFSANSGSFTVNWTLTVSAVATVISTVGVVQAYVWGTPPPAGGGSPHSGPVGSYIWSNPSQGIANPRSITNPVPDEQPTNNSWSLQSPTDSTTPVAWDTLDDTGTVTGSIPLFDPALESEGFQDFNVCLTGNLFVPAAGIYNFILQYKDQILLGIGGGATAVVTSGAPSAGVPAPYGQTITVINGLPIIFSSVAAGQTENPPQTTNLAITFPGPGIYQVEIDWDYWDKYQATMIMQCTSTSPNSPTIPPLPQGVRTNVSYACKFRNSQTGAVSNPGPTSTPQLTPVLDNTVVCEYSPDPQVDKVDIYRQDEGLANYTYVATGPNTNPPTPIVDSLSDLDAANNQIMDTDDFEPFPSIDTPKSGVVNVSGGIITWVSGDQFNIRWLAGTVIEIGSPTQLAYTLIARPTAVTSMYIPEVPDGTNLVYNIPEPILAAQPLAYLFGPTDNINFEFGVGDPLRPGTLYWCKGSNLDSAPDTNQMDVTDPSEPLVNGAMSFGLGVVFSIRRAWIIEPNFYNATATAQGVSGTTWSLQATQINRGLFMPRCLVATKSGNIFFRVDDGIHVSVGGLSSKSITDETLYPLFSHEGSTPIAITRNGVTIQPPDDTLPQMQQFSYQNGYVYYSYQGIDQSQNTLVFDESSMGWILDSKTPEAFSYAPNEGESVQGILVGCIDGTVRMLTSGGSESAVGTVLSSAVGGSGWQHIKEYTIEYSSNSAITVTPVVADSGNGSYAPAVITLPSTGGATTKLHGLWSPNKFKLIQFEVNIAGDLTAQIYLDGFSVQKKDWGSSAAYSPVNPFTEQGGFGGQP